MSASEQPIVHGSVEVGDKVEILTDIYDDDSDHQPPCFLVKKGEVLVVRDMIQQVLLVSQEGIEDSSFSLQENEWRRIP